MTNLTNELQVEYAKMVADLAKDGAAILETLTPDKANLLHMTVGICGEVGEMVEPLVNHYFLGEPLDQKNINEESGDLEFYIEGARQYFGVDYPSILARENDSAQQLMQKMMEVNSQLPEVLNITFVLLNVVSTSANFLDLVKKITVYNKEVENDKLLDAMANMEGWLSQLRTFTGVDRDEARVGNINKLIKGDNARYKSGSYSDEQAQLRRDKQDEEAAE